MKTPSVQARLTLWYTLLMAGMGGLLLGFLVLISGTVSTQTAMDQLEATLRRNLSQITQGADGAPQLGEEFAFYDNGVYTLVYSQGEALLAGQVPVSFTAAEPFQNGQNRPVDVAGARYYVMDFWLPNGWESGLWVRGILEAPENPQLLTNLMFIAMVTLPAFLLLAALGGYGIARRAFRPLKEITSTAAAINEAADLSARVAVPPGDHEFSRLAATFNQMFARLEGAFEAEKQFTADASHELRTPVSVIKSACEYAEKYGETPEEQRETLAMIHRQADRMAELIQQLLSITRLDQGTEGLRLEPLDLAALVEGVCAEQPYPRQRLFCQVGGAVWVRGDAGLLRRLLQNLIDNGFKYGTPQGHVWVTLEGKGNTARLQVRDDGIGIPEDQQEKVWQRFYQVDPSRREGGGAGLGLAMVKKIAQLHGGTVTLDSAPGRGSAFTLLLPREKKL
ncbi:MAG TPA: HAMP domain-containing histidine kinase [Candidatus Evtepia faecavium]|nr:HAMP domain-containing histidine kinase [Candidatus Evtepia faecavium]